MIALREARIELAGRLRQKPAAYDEFTIFGLPSDHREMEHVTVRDCLSRPEGGGPPPRRPGAWMAGKQMGSPRAATREMMLRQQITSLEHELHPPSRAFGSTRPLSARGDSAAPSPRPPSTLGSPRVNSARPRKALSDIRAYQAAGLTAQAHWPSPTITALIESSRGAPKAEEQMLLGLLKARPITPRPLWKIPRFERELPRVHLPY